jgi:hypothetical protein
MLSDTDGILVAFVTLPETLSPNQEFLRITEVNYHPAGAGESTEFIELRNTSDSETLDLTGVRFTDGPSEVFDFTTSAVTSLGPGAFALVVKDSAAMTAAYPGLDAGQIAGEFAGALSNGGESIRLEDADNSTIVSFQYEDGTGEGEGDWHAETDGFGFSLVVLDENAAGDFWGLGTSWRSSAYAGGSPGAVDPVPLTADLTGDGQVDRADAALVLRNLGTSTGAHRGTGDVDGDRATTLTDLALLQSNLGNSINTSPPAASAAPPDASTRSSARAIDAGLAEFSTTDRPPHARRRIRAALAGRSAGSDDARQSDAVRTTAPTAAGHRTLLAARRSDRAVRTADAVLRQADRTL